MSIYHDLLILWRSFDKINKVDFLMEKLIDDAGLEFENRRVQENMK